MSSGDASARGREHAPAFTLSIFIFKVTNIQRRLYCMAGALHKIENSSVALVTRTFLQTHFFNPNSSKNHFPLVDVVFL